MTRMIKKIAPWIVLVALVVARGGAAFAQAGAGSAGSSAPGAATPAASESQPPASAPAQPPVPPPAAPASDARKACADAMNADPQFAASIIKTADETAARQRDLDTLAAHKDANLHVQKNQRHVIYAYAAMWILAAGFVIYLWRRQQALKLEIANLRRDLDAADTTTKART